MDQLAKTRRHHRKERLKIFFEKKVSKFESDLMKTIESKSHKILQWGPSLAPHFTTSVKLRTQWRSHIFAALDATSLI